MKATGWCLSIKSVRSDYHWRALEGIDQLSFTFKGERYSLNDFEFFEGSSLGSWERFYSFSAFDGLVVKVSYLDNKQKIKVGHYKA
jgi:hypothetical protein|tara:strand:+ start:1931 stop:2188 length:258 start_codon:yes stop_codon:yes gene_type:complete